jgi:hypothetical protein
MAQSSVIQSRCSDYYCDQFRGLRSGFLLVRASPGRAGLPSGLAVAGARSGRTGGNSDAFLVFPKQPINGPMTRNALDRLAALGFPPLIKQAVESRRGSVRALRVHRNEALSVSPKIFEPCWRQFGIAHRVLDVLVAQISLQGSRIVPSVRQCVAAGMSKHVRVNACKLRRFPGPRNHLSEASRCKRRATLGGKNKR